MPLFKKFDCGSAQCGMWRIDESEDQLLALLSHSAVYAHEVQRFAAPRRRLEWLAVRALLLALTNRLPQIAYRSDGRPYLADASASVSISHTTGYAAVVLGPPGSVVGIDVEHYGDRVRRVAEKFMRTDEFASPYQGTDIWALLLHWSAKETMYKCLDASDVDFCTHLRVFPFEVRESGTFSAESLYPGEQRLFPIHYYLYPDFVLTLSV